MITTNTAYWHAPMITWLIRHGFTYNHILIFKTYITDLASFVLGVMACLFVVSFVLKNARVTISDTDEFSVTQMERNGSKLIFFDYPKSKSLNLSSITALVLILQATVIKVFPVKKIKTVDSRFIRIWWAFLCILVLLLCVFFLTMDSHVIMPDGNGGYVIKDIYDKM